MDMNKIIFCIVILGFAMFALAKPAVADEVYLIPRQSNATYSSTTNVEIWVNASNFYGGQINLKYDPTCANVTDWQRNATNFQIGGGTHYEGREWITFSALPPTPLLTGEYMIGILTIHCINEKQESCETSLAFLEPSSLFDDIGISVTVNWNDGTFRCLMPTSAHTPTLTPTPPSGDASIMPTKKPTSPITSNTTPNLIPTPTPTITPSPIATASPLVSPTPPLSPEEKRELPGFEVVFAILGLLTISYLISKRE